MDAEKSTTKQEFVYRNIPLEIRECRYGDEYFFYEQDTALPKYEDIHEKWKEFAHWIELVRKKNRENDEFLQTNADPLGREVAKWALRYDVYPIYLLTKAHWETFRKYYLWVDGCPPIVMEFMRAIMYKRMSEEEMWGTKKERKSKGKLIIFDKTLLPKEGQEWENFEVEYRPIDPRFEECKREVCPLKMSTEKYLWF